MMGIEQFNAALQIIEDNSEIVDFDGPKSKDLILKA